MKKIIFTIAAVFVLNILPFAFHPDLLFHYKTIFLILAACCIWLTQPAFSLKETKGNRKEDKFSILVILIAGAISIVSANIEWQLNNPLLSNQIITIIGLAMIVIGIVIRLWAIRTLGKYFTATVMVQQKQSLITSGPYKWVRHPSYLGAFLAIIGGAVFLNAPYSIIISSLCMTASYVIRIRAEEKALVQYFGDEYLHFSQKTKKLFPFIW